MRRKRRTKIVATLGPASSSREMIAALFAAGADVFRINMSHTSHERMRELVRMIRDIEVANGRPIGVLVDLQGPKLRVGTFKEDAVLLAKGADFVLDADPAPGDQTRVHLPHPEILSALEPGHTLLLDDGKIRLTATEVSPQRALTRVEVGGKLSARKGVSLPDTVLGFSALTGKDHSDLEAGLDAGADWIALSFIQRPDDIAEAKKIARGRAAVMAKMEKPQAIERLAGILDITDALMVARGDLGVELPVEKVPGLQKQMTRASRRAGSDGRRRHRGGGARNRRDARSHRVGVLDLLRRDRAAGCPRTPEVADRVDHAEPRRRPQARPGVGGPQHRRRGRPRPGRHGRPRLPQRRQGRLRGARPAHHRLRRRAAAHPRRHQHGAHRPGRPGGRGVGLKRRIRGSGDGTPSCLPRGSVSCKACQISCTVSVIS